MQDIYLIKLKIELLLLKCYAILLDAQYIVFVENITFLYPLFGDGIKNIMVQKNL